MRCPSCSAELADPEGVFCSRCGGRLRSREDEATATLGAPAMAAPDAEADLDTTESTSADEATSSDQSPGPDDTLGTTAANEATSSESRAGDALRSHSPPQGTAAMATEMAGSLRRAFRSGRWTEAASAAGMGFLAVLGVGALFVGLLKLVDPSFGSDRTPLWVLTRVVIAGLASLGIPIEQAGVGGSILPMGTLVLIAWTLVWAARAVVAAGDRRGSGERAMQGAKVGVPFALLCCIAALIFRLRDGVDTGADPGLALVIGGLWGALFGAAGGLLAHRSPRGTIASTKELGVGGAGPLHEGVLAGVTMLVSAVVAAAAAALIFVIVDLVAATDLRLTAGDAVALAILFVAFAPNIAVGTVAFSMGAPVQFVADSLGVGFRTNFSLFGWGGSGPEWFVYFAVLIPILSCLFGGYSARRRTRHPGRMIEIIAVATGTLSIGLSFLVYMGSLSLERGLLGPGNLLVLAPDASAVFLLSLLWAGVFGVVGWKVAEPPTRPDQHDPSESPDVSGTSKV